MRAVLVVAALAASGCPYHGREAGDPIDGANDPDGPDEPDAPPADGACAVELCNGADDDCDLQIDEDFALGGACDGGDLDACNEGVVVCSGDELAVTCNDTTETIAEACTGGTDDDCDGYADCQDGPCCADAACASGAFCCTGTGLVHTISNTCMEDFGSTSPSDNLEVYCCDGIARFCLSGEACPWRDGCVVTDATCQRWRFRDEYSCDANDRIYFP